MRLEDISANEREIPELDWERFMGNNREPFPQVEWHNCGSISFKAHLGKELSQELWNDLIVRLHIKGLCVYKYGQLMWSMGWGYGHCIIHLDENHCVYDIQINPYVPGAEKWTKIEDCYFYELPPAMAIVNPKAVLNIIKGKDDA